MEDMNFCPSCGQQLQTGSKFCPKCGRSLAQEPETKSSGLSFSKIGKGLSSFFGKVKESDIFEKAVQSVNDATAKVKETVKEKTEGSRVTVKVLGCAYNTSQEKVVDKMKATYGDGFLPTDVQIQFTTHAIKIYEISGVFSKEANLLYDIPLSTIREVYRQSNLSGNYIYYISTPEKDHPIYLSSEPYRFLVKLGTVLKMDGGLYNFDLLPDEKVVCAANGKYENSACTIYLTNKRLIVTKLVGFNKMSNVKSEGAELAANLEFDKITNIIETLGMFNADYTVTSESGSFTLTFDKEVPQAFLALVPGAVGNKELLEKKKKMKKGLKVAVAAAAILGAGMADGDDSDDDMDDDDMDDDNDFDDDDMEGVDMDGDGQIDEIGVDTDGDGVIDTVGVDSNGDGAIDAVGVDTDGDGMIDTVGVDSDYDGAIDTVGVDTDGNGSIDTVGVDTDGDGAIDEVGTVNEPEVYGADTDGDGDIDAVGVDSDGDGQIDEIGVDTDGDGVIDTVGVDSNGDGAIDAVGVDTDGDGMIDTVGVDSDFDGAIDTVGVDTDGDGIVDTMAADFDGDGNIDKIIR